MPVALSEATINLGILKTQTQKDQVLRFTPLWSGATNILCATKLQRKSTKGKFRCVCHIILYPNELALRVQSALAVYQKLSHTGFGVWGLGL